MKMRAPAVPLITVDPYFSVWSESDRLTDTDTRHWTNKSNKIVGVLEVDGEKNCFMSTVEGMKVMEQKALEIDALNTTYVFVNEKVELTLQFTTPVVPYDLYLLTRPVSYLKASCKSVDGAAHNVIIRIHASEELCLNEKGQMAVESAEVEIGNGIQAIKMGGVEQNILNKLGDDVRIDWGYFYLAVKGEAAKTCTCKPAETEEMSYITVSADISNACALIAFAYDDIQSLIYFGDPLKSYWNKNGETIETAIAKAYADYDLCMQKAAVFAADLTAKAVAAGGEKYAELLSLAYRQIIAAHKLVIDNNGELLYISKECFSNGCAATVDVSYPSIPMFLYYNPELVIGMMRPIFKYANGCVYPYDEARVWPFDFAPHDVGCYPFLNQQVYSSGIDPAHQMPVEECGNMLVMAAATSVAMNDVSYAAMNIDNLEKWSKYLIQYGNDPEHQLCTDDFAGHLAHNCNLSLKAIMGIAGLGVIYKMMGNTARYEELIATAKEMAASWAERAANGDGSYRLAFDVEGSFSMKYNAIWDKLFDLNIFPKEVLRSEFLSYAGRMQKYGMPLDNRRTYTKSDWLVWTATFADTKEEFEAFIAPLWDAYNESESRVPMTDWYETVDARQCGFQHRTVQGGLFIKMLADSGICKVK